MHAADPALAVPHTHLFRTRSQTGAAVFPVHVVTAPHMQILLTQVSGEVHAVRSIPTVPQMQLLRAASHVRA